MVAVIPVPPLVSVLQIVDASRASAIR